jgi:dienelactone hydrolase
MAERDSMRLLLVAPIALAMLAAVALPAAGSASRAPKPKFTTWDETFVDESRPTDAPEVELNAPTRTLVTTIYRPLGKGPFPLIVFAHGSSGHPEKFTKLFSRWAAAGYVVAAPAFPVTNSHASTEFGRADDVSNQPGDMSFVLDKVLALAKDRGSPLFRAIDKKKVGASGLSLGGLTTYELVYGDCCRDARFKAVEVLDGFLPSGTVLDGHVPLLIAHSDMDPAVPYEQAQNTFADAEPPVWLVTLHGASHASQWEDDVTPYDEIAEQITLDFWDATLRGKSKAFKRLERDATVADLSSIEVRR